jgi:hypothetical protein
MVGRQNFGGFQMPDRLEKTMSMFWRAILRGILMRRAPEVSIDKIGQLDRLVDPQSAVELRDIVGSELVEFGITEGEINEWGILCDELISHIGPLPD